jgi:hypothetical protein
MGGGAAGTPECGLATQLGSINPNCSTCMSGSCCQEVQACSQQSECVAIVDCITTKCAGASCQSCGGLTGTLGKSAECETCVEQSCCKAAAECANEPDCVKLLVCTLACGPGDTACGQTCAAAHPTGAPLADALATCLAQVPGGCPC